MPEMARRHRRVWHLNMAALSKYRPTFREPFPCLLFRATEAERWIGVRVDDPRRGWGRFIEAPIDVITLPGTHDTLLKKRNHPVIVQHIVQRMETSAGIEHPQIGVRWGGTK